jgi:adenylate cyclase
MLHAIMRETPLSASRLNPEIPAALDELIDAMLQKDPVRRPTAPDLVGRLAADLTMAAPRTTAMGGRHRPSVGRRRERVALRGAFDGVADGRGLLVSLGGEPGIGKTTLVEDALSALPAGACVIGRGRCSERLAGSEAYLPWLEALDSLLRGERGDTIARLMKTLAPTWYLQATLASDMHLEEMKAGSPERLKRELLALLEELSRQRTVVLFFDDLHWADASTVDLLVYIAARFDSLRVLVIITYRPTELQLAGNPFRAVRLELQGRGVGQEMAVEFLSRDDIGDYLALEFPDHRFPPSLVTLIHEKTEGNPLFMVDLVRDLRDRGVIVQDDQGWILARAVQEIEADVPASIRSLIQRKVDALEESDRQLLIAASVQGSRFDATVVARAIDTNPTTLEDRLDLLERVHGLVRLVGEEPLPDGTPSTQYRFVHVLYQNGLYGALRPARRAALSGAVARVLVAAYARDTLPISAELAFLFETARDFASAARHFLAAAQKASEVFAYQEMITLSRRGLGMLRTMPETPAHTQIELELQLALGLALTATKGYAAPEVEKTYARARALCQQEGDPVRLFRVLEGPRRFYSVKPNLLAASELAEQLLALAASTKDDQLVAAAHANFSTPLMHRGHFIEALAHTEQALALFDPAQYRHLVALTSFDLGIRCLTWSSLLLWLLGKAEQASARIEQALQRAASLPHPFSRAYAFIFAAWFHQYCRQPQLVRHWSEAALMTSTEHSFGLWMPIALIFKGWASAEEGRATEGIDELRHGLDLFKTTGAELNRPHFLSMLAEAYGRGGHPDAGLLVLEEAFALAERNQDRCWMAELFRLKGMLLLVAKTDANSAAEAAFRQAVAEARSQEAKLLELRAATSLCRLLRQQQRYDEARATLSAAYVWFNEGFDSVDLRDARDLLDILKNADTKDRI